MKGFQVPGFSYQPQIDFVLLQKVQRLVGGLTGDGQTDVGIFADVFLQAGEENVFAQGCADADPKLRDTERMVAVQRSTPVLRE